MIRRILFLATSLFLVACAAGPDYSAPENNFLNRWFSDDSVAATENIKTDWWKAFGDPQLEKYIAVAAAHNNDVKIALANVQAARAGAREIRGGFWPAIGADGSAERSKSSGASSSFTSGQIRNLYDAGFDASWELDIFGGTRRASEAANARTGAALAGYRGVMLAALSETARIYYETRGLQRRIALTEKNEALLKETYDLISARLEAGEASEFDLTRARGEYENARARLPNLEADLKVSIFSLSVLLGQPPEVLLEEMSAVQPLPAPPDIVPVGLRSDILRRRPDIAQAERELAAEVADIGAETAELFPKFFLTGDAGGQARTFGDVFTAAAGAWSLAGLVSWRLFEGGAIRARIELEEAESQAALAAYEKAVLEALRDAESALARYGGELETRRRLEAAAQSRRESVRLARALLDAGEADTLALIDAERTLITGEDDLALSETRSVVNLVALYTALGGGWESHDIPEKATPPAE